VRNQISQRFLSQSTSPKRAEILNVTEKSQENYVLLFLEQKQRKRDSVLLKSGLLFPVEDCLQQKVDTWNLFSEYGLSNLKQVMQLKHR
jgi:hypothetical protein